MKAYSLYAFLVFILFLPGINQAQIGTMIPSDRLPDGSTVAWQEAGCPFLSSPIDVTAFFDVSDFGAVGNGIQDDTDPVIEALEMAELQSNSGGFSIVFFPGGTYRITSVLSLPSNTVIKGSGADISILYFDHYDHALMINSENVNTGIEDIKLTRLADEQHQKYYIIINGVNNCWIRGVESYLGNSHHISLNECHNIEISGCYINECTNYGGGGNGYGIALANETHSSLIENNVFRQTRHAIVTGGKCHRNVVGYNASYEPHTTTSGGLGEWVTGDIELHGNSSNPGPDMGAYENLFEGNYFNWIWIDAYWGDNGRHNTFFRNMARQGGLVLEDHYESTNGGNHYNCNNDQNIVNNYFENLDISVKLRYGSPWGDGYIFSDDIGGTGHFAKNNKVYKVTWPAMNNVVVWEADGEEPQYLNDTSYYCSSKPDFMLNENWPFDPFDIDTRNPAAMRYESGGQVTITVGFSPYVMTGIKQGNNFGKELKIFPNPNRGVFYIKLPENTTGNYDMTIIDIKGKKIHYELIPDNDLYQIMFTSIPKGIYLVKISNSLFSAKRKIIIQ